MYEFHGWFSLSEAPEEVDEGGLKQKMRGLDSMISGFEQHRSRADLRAMNGEYYFFVKGLLNREISEASTLDRILAYLASELPGTWGILYDRNDEWADEKFAGRFRVRTLARGTLAVRDDPFFSPWQPTIED